MVTEEELRRKRVYVGGFAVLCTVGAGVVAVVFPNSEGFQGALLRVGLLLAAFWLALPTKDRPAAWHVFSSNNWWLVGGVVVAVAIPRLRLMFPVLAVFAGLAWFAKPRRPSHDKKD